MTSERKKRKLMPDTELFGYTVTIKGRLRGHDMKDVEAQIREGLILNMPMYDSLDDLAIKTWSEDGLDELKRRFSQ